jgi:uncharacterized integral membrane protein (TIGR00698 family)
VTRRTLPGLGIALAGFLLAGVINAFVPWIAVLTACVVIGIVFAVVRWPVSVEPAVRPGLSLASRSLLRLGIVLLGFRLSFTDLAGLGWLVIVLIVVIVVITFFFTLGIGRAFGLPGHQPLLVAAGFSICGASAIGAMSAVTGSKDEETATPVALVTLCGTLAIAVLPLLRVPLGFTDGQFGMWVGASVHDVGQVVATAQIAGASALAIAVTVKLVRVVLLAPLVAFTRLAVHNPDGTMPAPVPLFVIGFLAASAVRSLFDLPPEFLAAVNDVQLLLLGMALVGLGSAIHLGRLVRTGGRALAVAAISWVAIAALAWGAVLIASPAIAS